MNSDSAPDACRSTCVPAGCGDSVTDMGEDCDAGMSNALPGFCSSTCESVIPITCGDGVIDAGDSCDDGPNNGLPGACLEDCSGSIVALCDQGWGNFDVEPGSGVCDSPAAPGVSNWMDFDLGFKTAPMDPTADLSKGHVDCCNWNVQNGALQVDTGIPNADFATVTCGPSDGRIYTTDAVGYGTSNVICLLTNSGNYIKYMALAGCCGGIEIPWAPTGDPNLLSNGDFATGDLTSWTDANNPVNGNDIVSTFQVTAETLVNVGSSGPSARVVYQDFVVPMNVLTAEVTFDFSQTNGAPLDPANVLVIEKDPLDASGNGLNENAFRIDIIDPAGDVFYSGILYEVYAPTAAMGVMPITINDPALLAFLQAQAGSTLRFRIAMVESTFPWSVTVDNLAFTVHGF